MPGKIFITDQKKFGEKVDALRRGGPGQLHVLSDFDRTLLRAFHNGTKIPSLLAALQRHFQLPAAYHSKAKEYFDYYHPIERDPGRGETEKKQLMHEWWTKHFDLLVRSGVKRSDLSSALERENESVQLRDGAETFFKLLNKAGVPLVIMSASGMGGEIIPSFLKIKQLLTTNVHIISNHMIWDKDGKAIGVKLPIVNSVNKDETMIHDFPAYEMVKNRPNVILMGDSLDDIGMVKGFDCRTLLSFGYLNEDVTALLKKYQKTFDVVVTNDGPLDFINGLLRDVIK